MPWHKKISQIEASPAYSAKAALRREKASGFYGENGWDITHCKDFFWICNSFLQNIPSFLIIVDFFLGIVDCFLSIDEFAFIV